MNTDKDFLKRLKTGQKRMLKVGIVDDNSDILRTQILEQVDCLIEEYSIERIIRSSNDKMKQSRMEINLYQDFKDFEPTNEHERNILYAIRKMSDLFVYNQHCISQFYQALNSYYYRDIERQQKTVQTGNED